MDMYSKIKKLISEQLGVDEANIALETSFEDMEADSLDIVELIMALEEEFSLEIADEEVEKIKSVGDVVRYIESHV